METAPKNYSKFSLKFIFGVALCLFVRLIPFRAPNIEPVLAFAMPMGRAYGALAGFSFGALSIFLYDLATGTLGVRTVFTAGAYGLIGLASVLYFNKKEASKWDYVKFAIIGTLFFDALTGLTVGPLFFDQSFNAALAGQIPFTALHLLGNTMFAYALSPGLYNYLVKKKPARNAFSLALAGGGKEQSVDIISNLRTLTLK
jgi:uncharacterized membrane protein